MGAPGEKTQTHRSFISTWWSGAQAALGEHWLQLTDYKKTGEAEKQDFDIPF